MCRSFFVPQTKIKLGGNYAPFFFCAANKNKIDRQLCAVLFLCPAERRRFFAFGGNRIFKDKISDEFRQNNPPVGGISKNAGEYDML